MLLALGIWSASRHPARSGQAWEVAQDQSVMADARTAPTSTP